ncbi:MAG: PepSY domain-containing protein [Nitrospira sp.]|nr:PepSY domain-containing protein [Nitrospira sp.]MCP9464598.1 PepSY domain-containing protein [Nitrospira sp.]
MHRHTLGPVILTILLAVGVLTAGESADAGDKGKKGKVEMAQTAKVSIDQAIQTALEKVSGKVIEAELEHKHKTLVWEVEVVTSDNKVLEIHIDAESGAVIDVEEEKPKSVPSPKERGPRGKP